MTLPERSEGPGLSSVALKAMAPVAQTLSSKAASVATLRLLVLISGRHSCSGVVKGTACGAGLRGVSPASAP